MMTKTKQVPVDLLPCPFCGGGEAQVRENGHWTGQRSVILSVEIRHWCDDPETNHRSSLMVKGKTYQEAAARWNRRAAPATEPSEAPNSAEVTNINMYTATNEEWGAFTGKSDRQIELFLRQITLLQRALTKAVSLPAGELPSEHDYSTVMLNGNCLVKSTGAKP